MPHGDHWRPVGAIYRCTLMNSSHSSPKATIAITTQLGLSVPIIQAPMAGSQASPQAIAVAAAGAMGSLPGASLPPQALRDEVRAVRAAGARSVNVNFFSHAIPQVDSAREQAWREALRPYNEEFGSTRPTFPRGPVGCLSTTRSGGHARR
jgi:nitronate monooxygenase